jgi:peroxiredoxin (alkyl hydroperoxide reductase subunit C)
MRQALACLLLLASLLAAVAAPAQVPKDMLYDPGKLPPTASTPALRIGDPAPDFTLPSIGGQMVSLSSYRGKKNVVLSFVPAAFTPVCSEQWPGYNLARELIEARNAIVLGITVDNLPTLHAWCHEMGDVWFPVLSDFFPHGEVARTYGILRPEGVSERAVFVVDTAGTIRYIDIHDINAKPDLETLVKELDKLR